VRPEIGFWSPPGVARFFPAMVSRDRDVDRRSGDRKISD
jgi:hypothetical protein